MLRSATFRSVVALVLAAWMPFCCCIFTGVVNVCKACGPHEPAELVAQAPPSRASTHGCHHGHHAQETSPADSDRPRHHDDGPCRCDKDKLATIGGESIGIDFPAFFLECVFPDWEAAWEVPQRGATIDLADFALHKPPTTLLRLHCALTI